MRYAFLSKGTNAKLVTFTASRLFAKLSAKSTYSELDAATTSRGTPCFDTVFEAEVVVMDESARMELITSIGGQLSSGPMDSTWWIIVDDLGKVSVTESIFDSSPYPLAYLSAI
jgi:hypothetical protein